MSEPEISVQRDNALRGYEIGIYREGTPAVVVFMGDRGALFVTAIEEGKGYGAGQEDAQLELGRTYSYGNDVSHA